MQPFETEQELFWRGEFGNAYVERSQGLQLLSGNIALFSKILSRADKVNSAIEFGANIGNNMIALKQLLPEASFTAVEINQKAFEKLSELDYVNAYHQSILDFNSPRKWNLVLSKGVLIHLDPDRLDQVYNVLYQASDNYICLVEYYNPVPVEINYRGYRNKLFKRDFAGEMLDKFSDLDLVDYGFIYHRDRCFPLDDANWFLLKKNTHKS